MVVRSKTSEITTRWRRRARGAHKPPARPIAAPEMDVAARERGQGARSEDRALYACECGYAFEALVTTSVGCPHGTRTQAW
jgi:hypothetical protein